MIVTRSWLQEWIDISDISTEDLVKTLNSIGLEVAEVKKIALPKNVVVGKVISCQKHPNADRLSLCEVDVGNEQLQIVCGAKNAREAEYVAVAKIGAQLPNGMEIKPVQLRGVESFGMLCSASELGLPKMEDGIMLLDSSIGTIELGKELREYAIFQDEIIDIELTANRGDCLSVFGIARELATAFGKKVRTIEPNEDNSVKIGIGRLLNLEVEKDIEANVIYKAFKIDSFKIPFLIRYRLALLDERFKNEAEAFGFYVTHATGVIVKLFGYSFFESETPKIVLKKDEAGFDAVFGKKKGAIIGAIEYEEAKPAEDEEIFILQASFIDPQIISKKLFEHKIETDWEYYRSSRGSEPRLQIGIDYAKYLLSSFFAKAMIYAGRHEVVEEVEKPAIKIDFIRLDALIGERIDRNTIVEILKALGFDIVNVSEESIVVKTPVFRHDVENIQDVAEEIVRIFGIDNIAAKPLCFQEQNRLNEAYENFLKRKRVKSSAIAAGYFETVSFIFTSKEVLQKLGFDSVNEELDLLNPITAELNTLRTSLVPNLLEQLQRNIKNGRKRVKLFEIGTVFDGERNEQEQLALLFSGQSNPQNVMNQGKPADVTFADMVKDLGSIIGDFELKVCSEKRKLMHPYQCAVIYQNREAIGVIYKLTLPLQEELDLPTTYIAELDFDAIKLKYPKAKPFSVYQLSFKDLSFVVDKALPYQDLKEALGELPKEVRRFYVIDEYSDESLGEKKSITIRLAIQADDRTLQEEEIAKILQQVIEKAHSVGAVLR